MDGFCLFHLMDGREWIIPTDQIKRIELQSQPQILWIKGRRESISIRDIDQQTAEKLGIAGRKRTFVRLTPVKERHGTSFLVQPEAIAFIHFFEGKSIVGMPDGNTTFEVKESEAELEPIITQHGIFIREVSSYQEGQGQEVRIF